MRETVSPAFQAGDICLASASAWEVCQGRVQCCREDDPFVRENIAKSALLPEDRFLEPGRRWSKEALGVSMHRRRRQSRQHMLEDPKKMLFGPKGYPFDSIGEIILWARREKIPSGVFQVADFRSI